MVTNVKGVESNSKKWIIKTIINGWIKYNAIEYDDNTLLFKLEWIVNLKAAISNIGPKSKNEILILKDPSGFK